MKDPLYQVGEKVILEHPKYGGEYNVHYVFPMIVYDDKGCCEDSYGYDLGFATEEKLSLGFNFSIWQQPQLRKKYQPSTQSLKEMIKMYRQVKP